MIWRVWRPRWTGFKGRILWEWLSLLSVQIGFATATILIGVVQIEFEERRSDEAAVLDYFDRTTELVLRTGGELSDADITIARAHASAALARVGGVDAGRVLLFAHEIGLLEKMPLSLEGADLYAAELKGVAAPGVDFEEADIRKADFEGAILTNADFEEADARWADFKRADLKGASFEETSLSGAEFTGADLRGADLSKASGVDKEMAEETCYDDSTKWPTGLEVGPPPGDCEVVFQMADRD